MNCFTPLSLEIVEISKVFVAAGKGITPDEAEAIAKDIGLALNDQNLAIKAVGQISALFGPNGELLENNIMEITAKISPTFDLTEIVAQATKLNPNQ